MAERHEPAIFSIAAHRGFADALVAGLVPRYSEEGLGLARLTLLLPSTRAKRTISEAFVRHFGEGARSGGLLMPRMAVVGDLDLDETLGALLDPLGAADIAPAVEPTHRWLRLAEILREQFPDDPMPGSVRLRLARDIGRAMDRLLVEDIGPEDLLGDRVLDLFGDLAAHWQKSLHRFATVQRVWLAELEASGRLDAAARRNRLFDHAARRWKDAPPATPIVAAGVTSAAPALARLLRVIADLSQGAVVLPDFDLTMDPQVWDELGRAGVGEGPDDEPFARGDAVTHPQYHLKLLLNRMGVNRSEVQPWHRKGVAAARPERSHAVSSLFLPPEASKRWAVLEDGKRRLEGVRIMQSANPEEEAQAVALLVREAIDVPERRVAVVTPDRGLAGRIVRHLRRWNIVADDSAGQPLSQTPPGRAFLLLAEVMAERAAPVPLMALLGHPLVHSQDRAPWLERLRKLELALRGPRRDAGLPPLRAIAEDEHLGDWWDTVEAVLVPLLADPEEEQGLADLLDRIVAAADALCGDAIWAREEGRSLSAFVEDLRMHARTVGTRLSARDLLATLREAMDMVAVRPPWGGHPRVAILGLLESRMNRAELVICAGLNEGSWPAAPSPDPLLAPAVMRALGVPGADFRIGLAAHDLAGALGAPAVVLSRAARDAAGPTIPSRFLLRVQALMGQKLTQAHEEKGAVQLARALDAAGRPDPYPVPQPMPSAEQRKVRVSVTALDRLNSDPYQFYAGAILQLKELDMLDAEPSAAWQGTVAHEILETWYKTGMPMVQVADEVLEQMSGHPLTRALWKPRLMKALEWVEQQLAADPARVPVVVEQWGEMERRGVRIFGKADRIDRLEDGTLAVVDYKTGQPPSNGQVKAGYALQLGTLGLMAEQGGFPGVAGEARRFEYWSLGSSDKSETGFGYVRSPVKDGRNKSDIEPDAFLDLTAVKLDEALDKWILGNEPFTARLNLDAKVYNSYDQLMRLDEWLGREAE
ncbi:MAG: PD-(D/E)XK nuclease family protein [Sphingomonadales bacterium]|nr:PD-(D/E)XK nuclease family protein [Sphingomonadales bacterium]MBD3774115.1 PD-(D/E)XK nuclease family protein [Paracoccaceae bacterium]